VVVVHHQDLSLLHPGKNPANLPVVESCLYDK
jgi:hypothetical protein